MKIAELGTTESTRSDLGLFFGLTFGLSWLVWVLAALSGGAGATTWPTVLHYLGGLVPPLVATALIHLRHDRETRRDYWRRVIDVKRIRAGWYAVILLTVPVLAAVGALGDVLFGGSGARLEPRFVGQPLAILPFAFFTLFFGPLPEEIAWRGYALDRLQARWTALISSLILGAVWTLWHVPLFFIEGTYQQSLVGSLSLWLFMLDKIPQSILMTWIYNHNRRSTLSAVLFHFTVNFVGELFALTQRAELVYVLSWIAAALGVVAIWGPETLTRGKGE